VERYSGPERRKMNQEDHDLLLTIANDCKHMKEWCETHTKEDDQRHRDNLERFSQIEKNEKWQNKILYGALGIISFITFLSNLKH